MTSETGTAVNCGCLPLVACLPVQPRQSGVAKLGSETRDTHCLHGHWLKQQQFLGSAKLFQVTLTLNSACTACWWRSRLVIVLTECDLSTNNIETRTGDRTRFMPELLQSVCLACVCVRYRSSLLMHECLLERLCEIVPLHPCNSFSLSCASFVHFLSPFGNRM